MTTMTGIEKDYFELLRNWCERLMELQIQEAPQEYFRGGILCPACRMIHGRVGDAIYPMIVLYDRTGRKAYLETARLLFDWSGTMLADDGSYYNDAQNDWNGITVFFVSMLSRTLLYHGACLPEELRIRFEERLERNAGWIRDTIDGRFDANINYQAAAAEAAALYGAYRKDEKYLRYAGERARFCMDYFSKDGFLTGESHPRDYRSPRGVRGVDLGYNLEESLPALLECAEILGDLKLKELVLDSLRVHCRFLLPDGGMDNSFGSRTYKWTYWGSRTSDGYLAMLERAGQEEEEFLKYKYAAFQIFSQCTKDGLLYGGPDYEKHGELACVHHTFCKAKAVAQLLDTGVRETGKRCALPKETLCYRYPELLTEQYFCGGFYMTVTANDVFYQRGGHVSGGTVGLLWHERTGPLLAASVTKYSLYEVTNSQLSRKKREFGKTSLRLEYERDSKVYGSDQDFSAEFHSMKTEDSIQVEGTGTLSSLELEPGGGFRFSYQLRKNKFSAAFESEERGNLCVPLIGKRLERENDGTGKDFLLTARTGGLVRVRPCGQVLRAQKRFHLCGGFEAWELVIQPEQGRSGVLLEVLDGTESGC